MRTINILEDWGHLRLPTEITAILKQAKSVCFPKDRHDIFRSAMGNTDGDVYEVVYDVPGKGSITEATVTRCRNGFSVNYVDPAMRRRDPDCMVIGDSQPTDKCSYIDRFGIPFDSVRTETFD